MKQFYIVALLACALFVGACSTPLTREECWRMVKIEDMIVTCLKEDDSCKLKTLIDQGLPIHNYFDPTGNSEHIVINHKWTLPSRSLLLYSLHCGAAKCAHLLLDHKVNVSSVGGHGNNALMLSAYLPEEKMVEMVERISSLATFDVNATNCFNETALSIAIRTNNGKYIDWLLQHGADYKATASDWNGSIGPLPIWFYAVNARQDIFEKFINLTEIDFQAKDSNGMGVLCRLLVNLDDYDERFQRLVEKGAKLSQKDADAIVCKNMRWFGDCKTRVAMICSYMDKREVLKHALSLAKTLQRFGCVEVLENTGQQSEHEKDKSGSEEP